MSRMSGNITRIRNILLLRAAAVAMVYVTPAFTFISLRRSLHTRPFAVADGTLFTLLRTLILTTRAASLPPTRCQPASRLPILPYYDRYFRLFPERLC